ncbi:unnamed protein product [Rangifer tarandus platyrhynchus]|uniref:Uncharacterized protein n=1 Tax=Rangifer tarandus platyrhynchus TaxID=3082113 RepID=A0AC59YUD0_RANTA
MGQPVAGTPTHLTFFLFSESLVPPFLLFLPRCLCPSVSASLSLSLCLLVSLHLSESPCLSLPSGPLLLCLPVPPHLCVFPSLWSLGNYAPCTSPLPSASISLSAPFTFDLYSQLLTLGLPPPLSPRSSEAEQKRDEGWRGREGKSQWGEEGQPDRLGSLGIFVRAPPSTTQPAHL